MTTPAKPALGQQQQVDEQTDKKQSDEELKKQEDLLKAYDLVRENYYTETARRSWLKAYQESMDKTQQQDLWRQTFDFYDVVDPTNESKYWIGVQCVPKEWVKVNTNAQGDGGSTVEVSLTGGLVVNSVTANSPAESAGITKGDILISFGGQTTRKITDLSKAIDDAKGKESVAVVVRKSELLKVMIQPAERPKKKAPNYGFDAYLQQKQDYTGLQGTWDGAQTDLTRQMAWDWMKVSAPKLPADVNLTLVCKGNDDPIMIVKRGEDQWTIRKGKIDELPDDIKVYAGHIYRSAKSPQSVNPYEYRSFVYDSNSPKTGLWRYGVDESVKVTESIESLAKKVEQLQKTVEQLKKDR